MRAEKKQTPNRLGRIVVGDSHPLHPSLVCFSRSAIPQERTVLLECLRVGRRERNK